MTNYVGGINNIIKKSFISDRANIDVNNAEIKKLFYNPDGEDNTGKILTVADAIGTITLSTGSEIDCRQIITMDPTYTLNEGCEFNDLNLAITAAINKGPSATNWILIKFNPGTYYVSEQIVLPDYVFLDGGNYNLTTIILDQPLNSGESMITCGGSSNFQHITFNINTNADYGFRMNVSGQLLLLQWCTFLDPISSHLLIDQSNFIIFVEVFCFFTQICPFAVSCYRVNNALCLVDFGVLADFAGNNVIGGYFTNSPQTSSTISWGRTTIQNMGVAIQLESSEAIISNMEFQNCNIGLNILANSVVESVNMSFNNITSEVITDAGSSYFSVSNYHNFNKINLASSATSSILYPEKSVNNNLGILGIGNFSIGTPQYPSNLFVGNGGARNLDDVVILKTTDNVNFSNVSTNLKPSDGGVVILFDNLSTSILYIGSAYKFAGLSVSIQTGITLGSGSIVYEYWNGLAWTSFNIMTTQNARPYASYASSSFVSSELEDIRFSSSILLNSGGWSQNLINLFTKYFIRIRITSTILASPILYNIRLYNNVATIREDGTILKYGKARTRKLLPLDSSWFNTTTAQTNPSAQDVFASTKLIVGKDRNSFNSGAGSGFIFSLPADIDTSSPLNLSIAFISSATTASQPVFLMEITTANIRAGTLIYLTQPATTVDPNETTTIFSLTPNQTNGRNLVFSEVNFNLPKAISSNAVGNVQETIWLNISRLADSNVNSMIIIKIGLYYLSFKEGTNLD